MLRRFVALAVVAATVAVIPASSGDARSPASGLRLVAGIHHIDVSRFAEDPGLFLPPAVYVAPTSGGFQIDVSRHPGGGLELWQVKPGYGPTEKLRQIFPPAETKMAEGLPKFFTFTLRTAVGDLVAQRTQPFCPTSDFGAARVDASGPTNPSYPYFCGSRLTRRTVWGINRGWAVPVYSQFNLRPAKAPDGNYWLTVSITDAYARQMHLDPAMTSRTVGLTIKTEVDVPCPPEIVCEPEPPHPLLRPAISRTPRQAMRAMATAVNRPTAGYRFTAGLPDLIALPAHSMMTETDPQTGHDYLDFGATIWNAGPGTLDVEGFRQGDKATMAARQFFHQQGRPATSRAIGTFEFDNRVGHHHWHLEDVAQYDLLNAHKDRVVRSGKQSFCLAPTDPIDLTKAGALWQPDKVGLYSSCPSDESIWLRETLPVGWGDTYVQSAGGQGFDITSLPNGEYFIRVTTNPRHHILETTTKNNAALVRVQIGGVPGARTVTRLSG